VSSAGSGFAVGLTDRLELRLPGYLRWSFGESEGLTRPEWAIGGGWSSYRHDGARGNVWGFGTGIEARMRFRPTVAWRASAFAEVSHESRTRRDRVGHEAVAGIVWDARDWVSLGLESGEVSRLRSSISSGFGWIGGLSMPLVTFHLPPLDLGLTGATTWDGNRLLLVGGFKIRLTL